MTFWQHGGFFREVLLRHIDLPQPHERGDRTYGELRREFHCWNYSAVVNRIIPAYP